MFLNLAILDSLYEDRADSNLFAGRRKTLKATTMGSTPCCQCNYLVPLGYLVFHCKVSVTESHDEDVIMLKEHFAIYGTSGKMSYKVRG